VIEITIAYDRPHGFSQRLNEIVYSTVKERLLDGEFCAGQRLSAEALRTEFGVSKQPVMDSLRRLSGEGMVEITPQVGSVVATYQPREVQDFFLMFGGFEGSIAAVAAQRRTPEQLVVLVNVADECLRIHDIPDLKQRSRLFRLSYRRFHNVVHDMAHSGIMATTSQKLWDLSDFLIGTSGGNPSLTRSMSEREDQHEIIREAIAAGDSEAAEQAMTEHVRSAARFLDQVPRT